MEVWGGCVAILGATPNIFVDLIFICVSMLGWFPFKPSCTFTSSTCIRILIQQRSNVFNSTSGWNMDFVIHCWSMYGHPLQVKEEVVATYKTQHKNQQGTPRVHVKNRPHTWLYNSLLFITQACNTHNRIKVAVKIRKNCFRIKVSYPSPHKSLCCAENLLSIRQDMPN